MPAASRPARVNARPAYGCSWHLAVDTAQCDQTIAVQPNTTRSLSGWVRGSYVCLGVNGGTSTWTTSATA